MWSLYLVIFTLFLFTVPLLPSIIELIRPTDVAPLWIPQSYDSNPMHFAEGFRGYIKRNEFGDAEWKSPKDGELIDGTKYHITGSGGIADLNSTSVVDKLILSAYSLVMEGEKTYQKEIYSRGNITTGNNSHFRALLAEGEMNIGEDCAVLRWVHSEGRMVIARDVILLGRATSAKSIELNAGARFERLHAPIICTAESFGQEVNTTADLHTLEEIENIKIKAGRRHLLQGGLNFPAHHVFKGDIVANGMVIIGDNAHIKGSIKSNVHNDISYYLQSTGLLKGRGKVTARCDIGNNVRIDGALFSTHDLYIGCNCRITGPIIAENLMVIGAGTVLGSPASPCSVIAPEIIIEGGCQVFGTLWAMKDGRVHVANYRKSSEQLL